MGAPPVELLRDDEDLRVPEELQGAFAVLRRGLRESPQLRAGLWFTVVISLGVTAFLLTLAFRSRDAIGHDDVEDRSVPEERSFPDDHDLHVGERGRDHR